VRLLKAKAPASGAKSFIPALLAQDLADKELLEECRNAEREELRALHTEAQALADSNGEPAKEERAPETAVKHA